MFFMNVFKLLPVSYRASAGGPLRPARPHALRVRRGAPASEGAARVGLQEVQADGVGGRGAAPATPARLVLRGGYGGRGGRGAAAGGAYGDGARASRIYECGIYCDVESSKQKTIAAWENPSVDEAQLESVE